MLPNEPSYSDSNTISAFYNFNNIKVLQFSRKLSQLFLYMYNHVWENIGGTATVLATARKRYWYQYTTFVLVLGNATWG